MEGAHPVVALHRGVLGMPQPPAALQPADGGRGGGGGDDDDERAGLTFLCSDGSLHVLLGLGAPELRALQAVGHGRVGGGDAPLGVVDGDVLARRLAREGEAAAGGAAHAALRALSARFRHVLKPA